MMVWRKWRYSLAAFLMVVSILVSQTMLVHADSSSAHYRVTNTAFGSASTTQSCSSQYCAQDGLSSAAGSSSSSSETVHIGSVTGSHPELQVSVSQTGGDLGNLSTSSTATETMGVQVVSYLSNGYTMEIVGEAPHYGTHTINTLTSPAASVAGVEQFGINLAANTTPAVGADPVQIPSSTTSFGVANANYSTPNKFMYSNGDTVAHSAKSSGETNYTVSMILNISSGTPAGHYSGDFSVVVVPTY